MANDLNQKEDDLWDSLIEALKTSAKWHLAVKWIGILGVLVCAIGGGMNGGLLSPDCSSVTLKGLLVVLGALAAMASNGLLIFVEWETPKLMDNVRDQIRETRNFLQERNALLDLDNKRRALLDLHSDVYETCERIKAGTPLATVIQTMMDAGGIHLQAAMDTDRHELLAFSIFRKVLDPKGTETMTRIAVHWADRIREQVLPRTWLKQEGFTGWAWHDGDELIVPDVNDPNYAGRYQVPEYKKRDNDEQRYVSAAAIPIRVGEHDEIWGYVTATSNKAGRFKRDPTNLQSQNVETVRALSRLIATQVALRTGDR